MTDKITEFHGKYRFLSNFWLVPIQYDGTSYQSAEHAYQSQKTIDPKQRDKVNFHRKKTTFDGKSHEHVRPTSPGEAKSAGRTVTIRPDWDQIKFRIMEELVRVKFSVPDLRARLLATGDAYLTEGNSWHDTVWGVCSCAIHKGEGENHLGRILMKVRDEILAGAVSGAVSGAV